MLTSNSLKVRGDHSATRRSWLAGVLLFAAACSNTVRRESSFDFGQPKNRYKIHGQILRLRAENRIAVIKHEKIEGWMEAMTMELPVPDAKAFAILKEGNWIRATVNVNDEYFWLTDVVVET